MGTNNSITARVNANDYVCDKRKRLHAVYLITNLINGKCYIGKSFDPKARFRCHIRNAKNGAKWHLSCAIRLHGEENFICEILSWHTLSKDAYAEEKRLVKEWDLCKNGYNMVPGGCGVRCVSDESRLKNKLAHTGPNNHFFGKHHTEKTKQLLSIASSGSNNANYGKPKSDETKRKMSESQIGRKFTDEHREKLRLAKLGKKTGRKMPVQAAQKRRKPVRQIDNDGIVVNVYASLCEATRLSGFNGSLIMKCCLGRLSSYNGYVWQYIK